MGLTLEFFAGDKQRLIAAFREMDFEALDDPTVAVAKADLSLHILPGDLNTLSTVLGEFNSRPAIDLRSHLTVVLDEEGAGMLLVDDPWVEYAAAVDSAEVEQIAEAWASAMRAQYNDPETQATPAMVKAVSHLIDLCKTAREKRLDVLHSWNE
jgi:hypothetical protein